MHVLPLPLLAAVLPLLTAAPPATLLVLRAACAARDPAAFESPPGRERGDRESRVLGYHETCSPGWEAAVTRAALSTMSGGGAVALVGWPGAAACDALSAAARALRAPQPPACALPAARAAAVARLVARAAWRRAALAPAPPRSECRAALREVARALAAAGLTAASPAPDLPPHSQVDIRCVSRQRGLTDAGSLQAPSGAGAVLLLHVEEEPAPAQLVRGGNDDSGESNTTRPETHDDRGASGAPSTPVMSMGYIYPRYERGANYGSGTKGAPSDERSVKTKGLNSSGVKLDEIYQSDPVRRRRVDYLFTYIDANLPRRDLILVSEEKLHDDDVSEPGRLQRAAAEALRRAARPGERVVPAEFTFHVYRRAHDAPSWSPDGSFVTASTLAPDDAQAWLTEVRAPPGAADVLARAPTERTEPSVRERPGAAAALLAAGAGVLAAALAALAARWVAARRRRRRRGVDAVLAPADFSFPSDERRCVGDGMEAMLSCWLQQLHEFGGPELERPDLLKQPHAPSAPSSTCSVNRLALDRRVRYKGDAVHVTPLAPGGADAAGCLDLKRKALDVLLVMQSLRHENLNPFIGVVCGARGGAGAALVWEQCGRGTLEDVLMADDIKLDWTFRLSLLTDLVKGMRYLHASALRVHGRLSSRACVVDARWVLRVAEYGASAAARAQQLPAAAAPARDLLWTAPELLRDEVARARGSQPGDVYSFAIVMQEVIVRGEPYCMLVLSPEEIVEKLRRPPPLIRPSVSMGAAPPEAVSVMRQCWSEAPDLRPDFSRLHDLFRHLHRGRKINIVDSMFEMLEKYSNNLEELIKERTEQLDMEKKRTEQLLNRMLPRSVAERLLSGARVEPEEFSEVSIYFSDIVGFTALAARSSPVQVVDLLNDLYTTFDGAIERYRVYKVETIGDAYMVVGGLPARERDHAESVATMALHLLHLAGRFRVRHLPDTPLHLRIGLHSGPCCAAVVGLTMPRYCLFGDTVNTASRMESTGAAWRIQVSAATAERLVAAGGYRLRSRGRVMIKGKGAMHTYWLLGKEGFDKPLPTPPPLPAEEVLFETDAENEGDLSPPPVPRDPTRAPRDPTPAPRDPTPAPRDPTPAPPAHREAPALAAQDTCIDQCEQARVRSGAASADSSPPAGGAAGARLAAARSVERVPASYARYRWGAGGGAAAGLRRQWSLERGETLATAAAAPDAPALLGPRAPAPPRYRTRPVPPDLPAEP